MSYDEFDNENGDFGGIYDDLDCGLNDIQSYNGFIESHKDEIDRIFDENAANEYSLKYNHRKCSECGAKIFVIHKISGGANDIIYFCGKEEILKKGKYIIQRRCLETNEAADE